MDMEYAASGFGCGLLLLLALIESTVSLAQTESYPAMAAFPRYLEASGTEVAKIVTRRDVPPCSGAHCRKKASMLGLAGSSFRRRSKNGSAWSGLARIFQCTIATWRSVPASSAAFAVASCSS